MEIPHSSKTPNETEKERIMPVIDESEISTPTQKLSQSNQESNSANIVNVTQNSTQTSRKLDHTTANFPGASSSVDASTIIKNIPTLSNTSCYAIDFSMSYIPHPKNNQKCPC